MSAKHASILMTLLLNISGLPIARAASEPAVHAAEISQYGLIEIGLASRRDLGNPFSDAMMRAEFMSPAGVRIAVDGFFAGEGRWLVRFVPRERGAWTYTAELSGPGVSELTAGSFTCTEPVSDGFLRLSPRNPFRMEYDSGRPFYPLGVQTGGTIRGVDFDGPPGSGEYRTVDVEEWCEAFRGAVNLVRVQLGTGTTAGCAVDLIPDRTQPDRYGLENAEALDRMYELHRRCGFSEMAILFQDMSAFTRDEHAFGAVRDVIDFKSLQAPNLALQERYIRYVVARFACYVDIWEIFNEDSFAPDDYLQHLYDVIREADPYDHPITTNFSRPAAAYCDLIVPHQYVVTPDREVEALLATQIGALKSYGKVVQYSEFGNKGSLSNVDPVKWRLAVWTSFMNEAGMLFWSMSGRQTVPKPGSQGNSNAYLGPDSRTHFRAMLAFARDLPIGMRPKSVETHSRQFRAYCLGDSDTTVLYLHHYSDHDLPTEPEPIRLQIGPGHYRVRWIDPASGAPIGPEALITGCSQQYLAVTVPAFAIDLACRIDRVAELPAVIAIPPPPPEDPATSRWRRTWSLDATESRADRDWFTIEGMLDAHAGVLQLSAEANGEGEAVLRSHRTPASVRVEFVGWLLGEHACDLDVVLNAGARGSGSGYLFQFGGKGNTVTRLVRSGIPMASTERSDVRFEAGKAYRVVVENDRGALRMRVDGHEIFSVVDAEPLTGAGHDRISFYTFGGIMCVKDLVIHVLAEETALP
ncbi:MAG: DUF5060 domain-containing protein [Planctomycetes bacterium]|nr:DUF5060 domain-containing protein [Planctomycetota bacterium]